MQPKINIKRAYEEPLKKDGFRVLADRLWPRGVAKEQARIDEWAKDLAPTPALRKWYGHEPELWPEFQKKYTAELKANERVDAFVEAQKDKKLITLVYAAKDEAHTHALVLRGYLEGKFGKGDVFIPDHKLRVHAY
jgi:uncharacterized protein YeaO (DUF488 family)